MIKKGSITQTKVKANDALSFQNSFNKVSATPNQTQKIGSVTQIKYNNENNVPLFSYAHALKEGSAIPNTNSQN